MQRGLSSVVLALNGPRVDLEQLIDCFGAAAADCVVKSQRASDLLIGYLLSFARDSHLLIRMLLTTYALAMQE